MEMLVYPNLTAALDRHICNHGDYEALCEDLQDMDEPVRTAIAKARGEA